MSGPRTDDGERRVVLPHVRGRARLLLGMVLATVRGCWSRSGVGARAALATSGVANVNSTVWLLAGSLSWWRLVVATVASVASSWSGS